VTPEIANLIRQTAQHLGIDPLDLGTAISYETAGTFDPMKRGPTTKWGQHRGLIQFGEPQAQQFGVDWANPLESQLGPNGAVAKYLLASGFKPGMSGLDLYSTINAGAPGRYGASDTAAGGAPGDVRDKWENQMGAHRQKAAQMLGMRPGDPAPAFGPAREVADRPIAQPSQAFEPTAAPAAQPGQGGFGAVMAAAIDPAAFMPRVQQPGGPGQIEIGDGGAGVQQGAANAFAGAEKARALARGLMPDVAGLMEIGKRAGAPRLVG